MSFGNLNKEGNQKIIKLGLIAAGFVVVAIIVISTTDGGGENVEKKPVIYNEDDTVKSRYFNEAVPEIRNTSKKTKELEEENEKLKVEMDDMTKMMQGFKKDLEKFKGDAVQKKTKTDLYENYPMPGLEYDGKAKSIDLSRVGIGGEAADKKRMVSKRRTNTIELEEEKSSNGDNNLSKTSIYIPSGATTKAYLLGGVNAPTMTRGQNNPVPLLMKLVDITIIPNHDKLNLKDCFVLGEGYGDLSDERTHVRLTNLSCVGKSDDLRSYIDHTVQGIVYDTDGIEGLVGEVISKQGTMLWRTFVAGLVGGIGDAFSTQNQIVMASPYGTTTQTEDISTGQKLENSAYAGVGEAADKLADFYIKMAEAIEPRIETLGNKIIDIVITKGIKIIPKEIYQIKENEKAAK